MWCRKAPGRKLVEPSFSFLSSGGCPQNLIQEKEVKGLSGATLLRPPQTIIFGENLCTDDPLLDDEKNESKSSNLIVKCSILMKPLNNSLAATDSQNHF